MTQNRKKTEAAHPNHGRRTSKEKKAESCRYCKGIWEFPEKEDEGAKE